MPCNDVVGIADLHGLTSLRVCWSGIELITFVLLFVFCELTAVNTVLLMFSNSLGVDCILVNQLVTLHLLMGIIVSVAAVVS